MKYLRNIVRKKLSECSPCELVHLQYGPEAALALVLTDEDADRDDDHVPVAVLSTSADRNSSEQPFHDVWPKDRNCISFGDKWFLEQIIKPDLIPSFMGEGSGWLVITDKASPTVVLRQAPQQARAWGTVRVNLETGIIVADRAWPDGGAITDWNIWLSPEDRLVPGAEPFHKVRVQMRR